ncbi:MAG: OmpA family protein [Paludibacter sp.]|nr:OmpA family protein [Paludibacter sp.]
MKKFFFPVVILFLTVFSTLQAAENSDSVTFKHGWFTGLNGGINSYLGDGNNPLADGEFNTLNLLKALGYSGRFELGYHFSPVFSLRGFLGYNYFNYYLKNNSTGIESVRPFSGESLSADFMWNLLNIRKYDPERKWDFSLFTGLGAYYMNDNTLSSNLAGAFRAGAELGYIIDRNWALKLDAEGNITTDNLNDNVTRLPVDMYAAVTVGIVYNIPEKKPKIPAVVAPEQPVTTQPEVKPEEPVPAEPEQPVVSQDTVKPVVEPVTPPVVPEPEKPVVPEEKPAMSDYLNEHIFFSINQQEVKNECQEESMRRIAAYVKAHPNAKIIVSGYADRGIGSVDANNYVSKQRAVNVANMLIRQYGVQYKNIWVRWFGGGVQPYLKASKNRLVIVRDPDNQKLKYVSPGGKDGTGGLSDDVVVKEPGKTDFTEKAVDNKPLFKVVHFSDGDAGIIEQNQKDAIREAALYIRQHPDAVIAVSGYADKVSDGEKKSAELSKNRAVTVANMLIRRYSVKTERIQVRWYGAQKETGGQSLNRMVLIKTVQ